MYPYKKIISVVISSYNAQKTLQAALDALENQDIEKEKFEVIIVDDGSNDCSKQLIDKYIQKNTFTLKYFYQKNQGVGIARNVGVNNAIGDIIAFTDADCICDQNWLSVIDNAIRKEKRKFIGGYTYCNDTVIFPRKMAPVNHIGVTANLALNRALLPESYVLFDLGFTGMMGDDIDLVLNLENLGIPLVSIHEMRVQHPVNILSFERFLMRWKGRMNEVYLYKKHGKRALTCFSYIFKPRIFGRISLFSLMSIMMSIGLIFLGNLFGIYVLICTLFIGVMLFLVWGYKFLIIYSPDTHKYINVQDRIKTGYYFLVTIPLFFYYRIKASIIFRFFML